MADDPQRVEESGAPSDSIAAELARLRARVEALEAEVRVKDSELTDLRRERRRERREERRSERQSRRRDPMDFAERAREIADRADDEGRRLVRALVLSQMEQLRLTANLLGSFADEVARKNPPDDPDTEADLPRDVAESFLDTIDRSLEIPERTIDTFRDSYRRAARAADD